MSTTEPRTLEEHAVDVSAAMRFASPSSDPMRPQDLNIPPGVATAPPCCPLCLAFLHAINQNASGDILFECLSDHATGYQAVYRSASGEYEQRPGTILTRWAPPLSYDEVLRRRAPRTA